MQSPGASQRIGIDLGGTKIEGVLLDADGGLLERRRRATPQSEGYEAIVRAVAEMIAELSAGDRP